jgi:hypothetical protein
MTAFSNIKSLSNSKGNIKSIAVNGVVIWGSGGAEPDEPVTPTYEDLLSKAEDISSKDPFNGTGYMTGKYLSSSSPYYKAGAANDWVTGCIPWTPTQSIYIKGVSFTSASHDRMYFFSAKATRVAPGINSGTTNLGTYFTLEQLGTDYWKLTPKGSGFTSTTQWVRMSFTTGTPSQVIITVDEEIV